MSDGNFNRSLLPHTPYASGLKAGKQIAKMYAVRLYREYVQQHAPDLTEEELNNEVRAFETALSRALL